MDLAAARGGYPRAIKGCIFDLDGVSLASSHERAWREAIGTHAGAGNALSAGSVDFEQQRLQSLLRLGGVMAYREALRLVETLHALHWPMAVASWSANADDMLRQIRLQSGIALGDVFFASVHRDSVRGKISSELFLLAAEDLGVAADHCHVLEGAPTDIEAARAVGTEGLGITRFSDEKTWREAGTDFAARSFFDLTIVAFCGAASRRPA